MTLAQSIFEGLVGAFFASLGFGVLFNIRGKALVFAGIAGGVGGMVYNVIVFLDGNPMIANFFAAMALTLCAEIFARILKTTVTTFIACALIPLVPGGNAYRMMIEFMEENLFTGLRYGLETITIAGMLAIGILMVSVLTKFVMHYVHVLRDDIEEFPMRNGRRDWPGTQTVKIPSPGSDPTDETGKTDAKHTDDQNKVE